MENIDDRAAKKAEELLPCPTMRGCYVDDIGVQHHRAEICPVDYRLPVAAELREAYGDYDNLSKKSAHWYKSWEESQQEIEKLKSVFENLEQFLDFVLVVYDAREKELDKAYVEIARLRTELAKGKL